MVTVIVRNRHVSQKSLAARPGSSNLLTLTLMPTYTHTLTHRYVHESEVFHRDESVHSLLDS